MKKFIGITLLSLFLVGCGQDDISLVKNGVLGIDKSLTVGKAIDNYGACSSVTWQKFETDNGRKIVEADCQLTEEAKEYVLYNAHIEDSRVSAYEKTGFPSTIVNVFKSILDNLEKNLKNKNVKPEKIQAFEKSFGINMDSLKKLETIKPSEIKANLVIQFVVNKDSSFKTDHVGVYVILDGEEISYPTYDVQTLRNIYKNLMPSTTRFYDASNDNTLGLKLMYLAYPYAKASQASN